MGGLSALALMVGRKSDALTSPRHQPAGGIAVCQSQQALIE